LPSANDVCRVYSTPKVGHAFSDSYLAGEPAAHAFFAPGFRDPVERQRVARLAAGRKVPAVLLDVLREQQSALPASAAREANLDALAKGGAAVVATGQQVGLFLGPLYTFYKAASAVAVARAIESESGIRCVPLFWLQTEDHDFAEIRTCAVAGSDGQPVQLQLAEAGEARVSVAHRCLGADIDGVLDQLASLLDGQPGADEVLTLLRAQYRPGQSLAAAFAGVLATLFADEGLLFLDPRDARIASLVAPIYRSCLEDADVIERLLQDRQAALSAAGFATQVPVRSCALVFFHQDRAAGPRFRLQKSARDGAGAWALAGTTATVADAELLDLLAREPLRFSTSALLRPVVQDALLPTVAYVGGPGEINYFAELGPLYQHFGVVPPLLVPRARFRCVDARTRRWLQQSGLVAADLTQPSRDIRARLHPAVPAGSPDPQELRDRVARQILPAVGEIASAISATGEPLRRPAQRTRDSVAHALERLIGRYARGLVERDEATLRRIEKLEMVLNPGGVAQERFYGWPWLASRLGPAVFKRLVFERLGQAGAFATDILELLP
jgi:bacillithiol biosynthesis cysteine-adding enzyme BshC